MSDQRTSERREGGAVQALFDLTGKVALVTGGGRGLGASMARGLAEAGADVAIAARHPDDCRAVAEDIASRMGRRTWAGTLEVSQPGSVKTVIATVLKELGAIDILVNNSGTSWGAPFEEMPLDKWEQVLRVNATGTFLVTQAVVPGMKQRGWGRIINIASIAGLLGVDAQILDAIGYHASKGAVIALTRDLAVKLAPFGITVNAIAPGFIPTKMSRGVLAQSGDQVRRSVPMGWLAEPDDMKGTAVYLAGEGSRYVTGQVIAVDGGTTAW